MLVSIYLTSARIDKGFYVTDYWQDREHNAFISDNIIIYFPLFRKTNIICYVRMFRY